MEPSQVAAMEDIKALAALWRFLRSQPMPSDPNPFPKFHLFRWRKP